MAANREVPKSQIPRSGADRECFDCRVGRDRSFQGWKGGGSLYKGAGFWENLAENRGQDTSSPSVWRTAAQGGAFPQEGTSGEV